MKYFITAALEQFTCIYTYLCIMTTTRPNIMVCKAFSKAVAVLDLVYRGVITLRSLHIKLHFLHPYTLKISQLKCML